METKRKHSTRENSKKRNSDKTTQIFRKYKSSKQRNNSLKCPLCLFVAANKYILQYHILDFHKAFGYINVFKCAECPYKTLRRLLYTRHKAKHQIKLSPFHCANCPFETRDKNLLKRHMSGHTSKLEFKCAFCNLTADRQSTIEAHQWLHPQNKKLSIFNCNLCTYSTRIKYHYERHQIVHRNLIEKNIDGQKLECNHCPFYCYYKSSLQRHLIHHEGIGNFKCDKCSFTGLSKTSLSSHKKIHIKKRILHKKLQCSVCCYETDSQNHFNRHLVIHSPEKDKLIFKCYLCCYGSIRKDALRRHLKTHDKAKLGYENRMNIPKNNCAHLRQVFACSTCTYMTNKRSNLNRHYLTHEHPDDIKWFICKECPFRARRKYQLTNHMKGHNSNNGMKCFYCSYRSLNESKSLCHFKLHL